MELLYLWIDNDGMTIKNQSFNFSNHIHFTFERNGENNGLISLVENPNYIDNFFGESLTLFHGDQATKLNGRILNVTGIIGENGVGKTNLLKFIIDLLTDRLPIREKFIVAFKDDINKSIKIFHTLENFNLTTHGSISGFIIENPVEQKLSYFLMRYSKDPPSFVDDFGLIFYSPVFDLRDYPPNISNENKEYIDVSTNALIEKDVIRKGDSYPEEVSALELHKYSNIRRQFEMLLNPQLAEMQGLNLPKELNIIFHRHYFNPDEGQRNLTFESESVFKYLDESITNAWSEVNSKLSSIDNRHRKKNVEDIEDIDKVDYRENIEYRQTLANKLKIEFTYSYVHNYFHNLSRHYNEDIEVKVENIIGESLFERAKYFFENQKWSGRGADSIVQTGLLYTSMLSLIDNVDFDKNGIEDDSNTFVTDMAGGVIALTNYENYISSIPSDHTKNFISTSWRNISSGENALMDLYSRLFFAKEKRLEEGSNLEKPPKTFLYIIIDEGEVGFHPLWQSQYLYNLITFISHLFSKYKVQIILTSHSPFIVSDLPQENLIFLEKNEGLCKIATFTESQTFASNIHTLLSDQFFMKDGVIGKFARTKLQEELKPLLDKNNKNLDSGRLKKIVAMIGEPVLRAKLTEILNTKTAGKNV